MSNQPSRLTGKATGMVQGVSFRWFVQRHANDLGLGGYVRNNPDGSVSFVAEGSRELLERLLDIIRVGPPEAVVENVETEWNAPTNEFYRFEIRF